MAEQERRGRRGEGSVYYDKANGAWIGAVSRIQDGRRVKHKVTGRTKTEAARNLRKLRQELDKGIRTSATYTVGQCIDDWLSNDLDHVGPKTRKLYTDRMKPVREAIGGKLLRDLSAADVRKALSELGQGSQGQRSLQIQRNCLERAIRYAEAADLVGRNVASLTKTPKSAKPGRPSKSMTLEQASAVLAAAEGTRLEAYVVLSLLTGVRTEEARALRWDHVVRWAGDKAGWQPVSEAGFGDDGDRYAVYVWRSVRAGNDTKTERSRRTLELPERAVRALREHRKRQAEDRLKAGELWQDHGLVFASLVGTPLEANNVERAFAKITQAAGIGKNWVPRELRHTFVSIMSMSGAPVESISQLVGHQRTATTELVYRHELRPSLTQGAEVMAKLFG